jgi:hypothetical protein
MTNDKMEILVKILIEKTNISKIAENIIFQVNNGKKKYTFENAIKIAKRVFDKTHYASIKYKKNDGYCIISEIEENDIWLYFKND